MADWASLPQKFFGGAVECTVRVVVRSSVAATSTGLSSFSTLLRSRPLNELEARVPTALEMTECAELRKTELLLVFRSKGIVPLLGTARRGAALAWEERDINEPFSVEPAAGIEAATRISTPLERKAKAIDK